MNHLISIHVSFRREHVWESLCDTSSVAELSSNLTDSTANNLKSDSDINIIIIIIKIINNNKALSCSGKDC